MKMFTLHLLVFIIVALSCTNTSKKENILIEEKEENTTSQTETGLTDNDLFLLIAEKVNDSISLEDITTNKDILATRDNHSALVYFTNKHKEALKDVKSAREATYSFKNTNEKIYLREWHFKTPSIQDSIKKVLLKGFDGYAPPVKAPHYVFQKDSKLYVMYVKAEYQREYMNRIKQTINDSILKQ